MPIVLTALIALAPTVLFGQEPTPSMRFEAEQMYLQIPVSVGLGTARQAFAGILRSAERPGGMVILSGCAEPGRGPMYAPEQSSVASALYRLTTVYPEYYWTVQDGVIDLLPKQSQPPVIDLRIQHFEWDTTASVHLSVANVFQAAAVRSRLTSLGIASGFDDIPGLQRPPRVINGVPVPEPPPNGRKWKVENLSVLAVLNAVAASYGTAFWWYEECTCDGKTSYRLGVQLIEPAPPSR
jgi:hypothetical protein